MTIRSYQYLVQALVTPSTGSSITRNVTHGSVVSQEVEGAVNAEYTGTVQNLGIEQFVAAYVLPGNGLYPESQLGLQQNVHVFGWESVESELGLTQEAIGEPPQRGAAANDLWITQQVVHRLSVRNMIVESELDLESRGNLIKEFSVTSPLNLNEYSDFTYVFQDLNLVQEAEWGYGFDIESPLNLNTVADKDQIIGRVIENSGVVQQAAAWYIENRCARHQFKTFHGEGGVAPQEQGLEYTNTFLLFSQKDGEVLELRNPETDNRRRYSYNRVNRSFFDGTLDMYTDENSITEDRQIYTIVANKRAKLDALHAFMKNNLGLEVWLKDWKGVTWNVIILNPGEVYTEDGEGVWTIDFEVIGDRYPGEPAFTKMSITDALSRAGSIWTRSGTSELGLVSRVGLEYNFEKSDAVSLTSQASFTITAP